MSYFSKYIKILVRHQERPFSLPATLIVSIPRNVPKIFLSIIDLPLGPSPNYSGHQLLAASLS